MEDDDYLLEYYEACCASDSSEDSSERNRLLSDGEGGQSPWRATSGDSPLRGRARLRSPKHRSDLLALKLKGSAREDVGGRLDSVASCGGEHCNLQQHRSTEMRVLAQVLANPLGLADEGTARSDDAVAGAAVVTPAPLSRQVCYQTEQQQREHQARADEALQQTFVFDVLSALRQSDARYCECVRLRNGGVKWRLKAAPKSSLHARGWDSFIVALESALSIASRAAALRQHLHRFHDAVRRVEEATGVARVMESAMRSDATLAVRVHATLALGAAAFATLCRLAVFIRTVLRAFNNWVLEAQELAADGRQRAVEREAGHQDARSEASASQGSWSTPPAYTFGGVAEKAAARGMTGEGATPAFAGTDDGASVRAPQLLDILTAATQNAVLLERLHFIVEESACFSGMWEWADDVCKQSPKTTVKNTEPARPPETPAASTAAPTRGEVEFADTCADLAALLLDYLIVRLSALQDTSSMDLYRVYVALLLHCSWPYVQLTTSTVCGFVHSLDPKRWRQQLPRLFRSSFSHIRLADARRRAYPTDVLSLMLNCVGYDAAVSAPQDSIDGAAAGAAAASASALSALQSSRIFVLRCVATTAARNRSRGRRSSAHRRSIALVDGGVRASRAERSIGAAGGRLQRARDLTTAEIVNELLSGAASGDGEDAEELGSLLASPHELYSSAAGSQRGAAPSAETAVSAVSYLALPSVVPLGFAGITRDLPGLASYRRKVARARQREGWLLADCTAGKDQELSETDDRDPASAETDSHPRASGALWHLCVSETGASPDLVLVSHTSTRVSSYSSGMARRSAGAGMRELWINTTIPAARWIAAALLIPIGVVIQRVQKKRLDRLFRPLPQAQDSPAEMLGDSSKGTDIFDDVSSTDAVADGQQVQRRGLSTSRDHWANSDSVSECVGPSPLAVAPPPISFFQALRLLVDVALCRDKARLVDRFVERLHQEPFWWHRRDVGVSGRTASSLITNLFSESLRGKRHGDLVRLTVLPKKTAEASVEGAPSAPADDMLLPREMLDVFASFKLHFSFPADVALVLLPSELCLAIKHSRVVSDRDDWDDAVESTYSTFFWERRRGHYGPNGPAPQASRAQLALRASSGLEPADVWSYAFGYLCALHYAQISLREQRKAVHTSETEDRKLLSVMGALKSTTTHRSGPALPSSSRQLSMISRRRGTAYYTLSFAVDALLSFTLREVSAVIYRLERVLAQADSYAFVTQLCHELDSLLLRMQTVCFPARPALDSALRDQAQAPPDPVLSAPVDETRAAINTLLALSLDASRLPVHLISTRSRNTIEALVSMIAAMSDAALLKTRLNPLLVSLTFNRFYGWEGQPAFGFR